MRPARPHTAVGAALLLMGIAGAAHADNRGPLALGGATGAMGGTGVAFGGDAAMAFLNPAGLSRVPSNVLSMSLSAYNLDVYRYDDFFAQPDPPGFMGNFDLTGNSLSSSTVSSIPTSLTYVLHLGEGSAAAVSILIPSSERRELDGTIRIDNPFITANSGLSLVRTSRSYFIGPSYAVAIVGEAVTVRLGASVFFVYSERTSSGETEDVSGVVPATDFQIIRSSFFLSGNSYDALATVGVQLSFGSFSVGLSVHSPSLHLGGSFEQTGRITRLGNGALDTLDVVEQRDGAGAFAEQQPLRAALGLGLELSALRLGADVSLIVPLGFNRLDGTTQVSRLTEGEQPVNAEEPLVVSIEENLVVNFSVGAEYRISDAIAVRAGGFSDFSTTDLSGLDASALATERIDRFGGTLGLGFRMKGTETNVAFSYVGGVGKVLGLDVGNFDNPTFVREVDALQSTFGLIFSGAVDLGTFFGG